MPLVRCLDALSAPCYQRRPLCGYSCAESEEGNPSKSFRAASASLSFVENVMTIKSPLALVKERFQDKDGLISALKQLATEELWIDRVGQEKGLDSVSNKKLLKLHTLLTDVKKQFGTRSALIDAILTQEKRNKDDGYKSRLARFSTPRLFDQFKAGKKRAS
jgi:hypothetical protein